jgi:hypothetical protein
MDSKQHRAPMHPKGSLKPHSSKAESSKHCLDDNDDINDEENNDEEFANDNSKPGKLELSQIRELESGTLGCNISIARERTISSQDVKSKKDIYDIEALIRSKLAFCVFSHNSVTQVNTD